MQKNDKPVRYKKGLWLTKDNRLVTFHGNMTPTSYKITNYFLWKAVKEGRLDKLKATGAEVARTIGIKRSNYSEVLYSERKKVMSASIEIEDINTGEKKEMIIIPTMEYSKGNGGEVSARVNPDLEPYIMNLAEKFSRENLVLMNNCGTYPAMRMYELCNSWRRTGMVIKTVEEWRGILGATRKTYDSMAQFKRGILTPAIKEVNKKTDLCLEPEYIKSGRNTTHIKMRISEREVRLYDDDVLALEEAEEKEAPSSAAAKGHLESLSIVERAWADLMIKDFGFSEKQAAEAVTRYGLAYCSANMEYTKQQQAGGNVRNPGGYLLQALEADYAGSRRAMEQAKAAEAAEHEDKAEWNRQAARNGGFSAPGSDEQEWELAGDTEYQAFMNLGVKDKNAIMRWVARYPADFLRRMIALLKNQNDPVVREASYVEASLSINYKRYCGKR